MLICTRLPITLRLRIHSCSPRCSIPRLWPPVQGSNSRAELRLTWHRAAPEQDQLGAPAGLATAAAGARPVALLASRCAATPGVPAEAAAAGAAASPDPGCRVRTVSQAGFTPLPLEKRLEVTARKMRWRNMPEAVAARWFLCTDKTEYTQKRSSCQKTIGAVS